jgi:hypothetical protein
LKWTELVQWRAFVNKVVNISYSMKAGYFIHWLSKCQHFKEDCVLWNGMVKIFLLVNLKDSFFRILDSSHLVQRQHKNCIGLLV